MSASRLEELEIILLDLEGRFVEISKALVIAQGLIAERDEKINQAIEALGDLLRGHDEGCDCWHHQALNAVKAQGTSDSPEFEYRTTQGGRKTWDGEPDLTKEGWENRGWERFDFHEEIRWRRPLIKK